MVCIHENQTLFLLSSGDATLDGNIIVALNERFWSRDLGSSHLCLWSGRHHSGIMLVLGFRGFSGRARRYLMLLFKTVSLDD